MGEVKELPHGVGSNPSYFIFQCELSHDRGYANMYLKAVWQHICTREPALGLEIKCTYLRVLIKSLGHLTLDTVITGHVYYWSYVLQQTVNKVFCPGGRNAYRTEPGAGGNALEKGDTSIEEESNREKQQLEKGWEVLKTWLLKL